jgi:CzcA family heavy metal efflux pump
MMRWLIESSMKLRLVVVGVAALLVAFGVTQLRHMPIDALPEFTRPSVEIQTEALGLSAQEVEAMITTPIEADMINGTPWADEIRSVSIPGMASITLLFDRGIDVMKARQVVQERLTQIFVLPHVSKPATMVNPVASAGRTLAIGLTSDKISLIDMSVLARWTIAPRLMGLPGVANVSIWGERQRQLQVRVEPEKLRAQNVSLMQVVETAGNSLWASPLSYLEASTPGTGGWIETPNQRLGIRHILPIQTAADLAKVPITGAPGKRLGDVATLVEDHQPLIGDAFIKDVPSLMLVVEKFPWANSKDVTAKVESTLASLRHGMSGIQTDTSLFRPATFLELAVKNYATTLLVSAVLLMAAFFAFFLNWRTALISIVAVVTSVLAAAAVLYVRGVEVNLIIMVGLMIGLSVLIDDAIVDVENVGRRLRQARQGGNGRLPATIICEALLETRRPILYATGIMVLSVVPLLFLKSVSGAFFQPLALSYMLALLASLVVALSLTPALSVVFLRKDGVLNGDSPVARVLRAVHGGLFGWAAHAPRLAFGVAAAIAVVGVAALPSLRQESLLPDLKETDLVVRIAGSPAASHPAMSRITTLAGRELRAIPGVRNVSAHMGRAIMSDKRTNINASELWISIDPAADYEPTVARIKDVVAGYPGLSPEVLTYHHAMVREELSGTGESLVVRVYGEDTKLIAQKAEEVQQMLTGVNGVTNPKVQYPEQMPTLEIEVNIEKAREFGLKPGDVRRAATSLVSGIVVGSLFEQQKVFDVVVWGAPQVRESVDSIQNLLIDRPNGASVPLRDVADVRIVSGEAAIHRDAVARRIDVTADVSGRDMVGIATDVEAGIGRINFPLEYRAELRGEYAERLDAENRVIAFAVAAALGILLLMQAFFRSWRLAFLVMLTLPMALAGGVIAALVTTGGLLTLGGIMGFVTILGIAVRNSITLIDRYRQLESEDETFGAALVRHATHERSAPILMTALTTALVFLPFAFAGSIPGLEFAHPMALVVLGGLVTTTPLALVGVPALYLLFGASREADLGLEEQAYPVKVVVGEEVAIA